MGNKASEDFLFSPIQPWYKSPPPVRRKALSHYVYILQSGDGRYYTGYTTDLKRRLKDHQSGTGAKFTRSFGAEKILYHESFEDKSSALKREAEIKRYPRCKKETLFSDHGTSQILEDLS